MRGMLSWQSRVRPVAPPPRTPRLLAAVVYLALVPIAALLAVGAEFLALSIVNATRIRYPWLVVLLNIIPALVTGFLVYAAVARGFKDQQVMSGGLRDHLLRCSALYCIVLLIGGWMAYFFRSPGFGIFLQIILWPWLAIVGGVVADGWVGRGCRTH